MTKNTPHPSSSQHDNRPRPSSIPEPPNVPVGGIPDLEDDADEVLPNQASSEAAEREQERQQKSGEENPA